MNEATYTLEFGGKTYADFLLPELVEAGVEAAVIGAAIKADAKRQVADFAESYRARLATRSAGKLAEYRIKEEIARNADAASAAELDLLSREAKARGTNRTGLIGQINAQAAAYRQIALLIGVLESEAGAAISAIADDAADIEEQIAAVLSGARTEAEAEYQNALALMAG